MGTKKIVSVFFSAVVLASFFSACKKDAVTDPSASKNSYDLMATKIFNVNCVQCHNDQDKQGAANLSLEQHTAYDMLVNAEPTNAMAKERGLFRVTPSHTELSFLMLKLTGNLEPGMGVRMPHSLPALSEKKIEFIRQWIAAGAPKTGSVADESLLEEEVANQKELEPLPVPEQGFQLHLQPFSISPTSEREIYVYENNPSTTEQYVNKVKVRMREGSHHFILYTFNGEFYNVKPGEVRPHTDKEMQEPRNFLFGAQTPEAEYAFPDSIAVKVAPNTGFDLNSHYVNQTTKDYQGEAYINVYTVPKEQVKHVAQPFLWVDNGFTIPPHSSTTRTYEWQTFTKPTHYIVLSSHAHKRMTSFKIFIKGGPRDSEMIYDNSDWQTPTVLTNEIILNPGEKLRSETTWYNESDKPIQFGFTSEDEMNILVGYYWQ